MHCHSFRLTASNLRKRFKDTLREVGAALSDAELVATSPVGETYLQTRLPGKTFAVVEARDALGGTWDLFRYPNVRSDSDIITLSFSFAQWKRPETLAAGPRILEYLKQTADEFGITEKIKIGCKVTKLEWSSASSRWTATVVAKDGATSVYSAGYVVSAAGYYSYDKPYLPEFEGMKDYKGVVAVPQFWPEDLDYTGKKVVVIGSGATAITVVPALAAKAAHVTMVQRSPSYTATVPSTDPWAAPLRRFLGVWLANKILWVKNVVFATYLYNVGVDWGGWTMGSTFVSNPPVTRRSPSPSPKASKSSSLARPARCSPRTTT